MTTIESIAFGIVCAVILESIYFGALYLILRGS